jgi:hypothetical protein
MITPVVNRTLHTYHNTLRILCEAFQIEFEGHDHRCERLLIQQAFSVHRAGKMLVPIIETYAQLIAGREKPSIATLPPPATARLPKPKSSYPSGSIPLTGPSLQ